MNETFALLCWWILTKSDTAGNVPVWPWFLFLMARPKALPKPHGRRVPFFLGLLQAGSRYM
ncbi:hypothetical protein [Cupriavidus sp. IDO]|uniref:hypothetical protein n=1 Tax=Cupriavidus sp. IDO TaxID=1539142 RepID=UPI001269CB50|nr:hypothetical protein [Cupriavidus sp. IDO]